MNTEQILLSLTDLRHNLRQAQFPLDVPEAITQAGLARRIPAFLKRRRNQPVNNELQWAPPQA